MQTEIEGFRLSPQQRRVWKLQAASRAFNARCLVAVEGELRREALAAALARVVARHEIFRTAYHCQPGIGTPIQVIADGDAATPILEDATGHGARQQGTSAAAHCDEMCDEMCDEIYEEMATSSFDDGQLPQMRAHLFAESAERHVLLLCLPSICADARTLANLVGEIAAAYGAVLGGEADEADEPTQYLQFSEWQNELLEDEAEIGRDFWHRQSPAAFAWPTLPGRIKGTSVPSEFSVATLKLDISPTQREGLKALAVRRGLPLEAVLLACWQTLLWRLTGQTKMIVGVELDGRKHEELEEACGLFAKAVPVSCDFEVEGAFDALAAQTRDRMGDAAAWQEYFTFEETFGTDDEGGAEHFLPVGFSFGKQAGTYEAGGASFRIERQSSCIDRYELKLSCVSAPDSMQAEFQYDPACFTPESVGLVARCFGRLVESVVGNPDAQVGELEVVLEGDRSQLSNPRAPESAARVAQQRVHTLFEAQAARTPDALAVRCGESKLTYDQLNARANKIAHHLIGRGIGADVPVGLCVERSLDMIAGLLGILKAGGAYLPLDPGHPETRLAFQLAQSRSPLIITRENLLGSFAAFEGETICFDRDAALLEQEAAHNPEPRVSAHHLVYVIYTSGSTGEPKGVAVTHGNLANYTAFVCELLNAGGRELHFATVSTISADLGNTCVFPSLVSGGCLHLVPYAVAIDGDMFAAYLAEHPVDVLKIVPSHFSALLDSLKAKSVFPRKFLFLGGESLSLELVGRISEAAGDCQLINHYGPTETTVGSLFNPLDREHRADARSATVPIGRPIPGTEIYILNSRLKPVPVGAAGELYIGGAGVSRGYIHQPEQTDARFIPHPFKDGLSARLYRTGDLARQLPGGDVEFLGRVDRQVKIRGFRVELGEIEAKLSEHPEIREAAVIARQDEPGQLRLVAYCVAVVGRALRRSDLHGFLKQRLPEHMIPTAFVTLNSLPLTANGKVNREALPAPEHASDETDEAYVAPRSPVETALADIWREVLGVARVGIYDNFFSLGGDSIISIQIIARARRANLSLSPKDIFDYPTVSALAQVVKPLEVVVEQGEVSGEAPLTPIQSWFFQRRLPQPQHYNQSLLFALRRPLDPQALAAACAALLSHHDALRLRFTLSSDGWRQSHAPASDGASSFHRIDLSTLAPAAQSAEVERLCAAAQQSFDLATGPLFKVILFDCGTGEPGRLLLLAHHLVVDGVSWRILLEDLQSGYEQAARGEVVTLPAKTTSFAEWARRLADHAAHGGEEGEVAYWQAQAGAQAAPLPIDHTEGENTLESARTLRVALNAEETIELLRAVPAAYGTRINDALLAGLAEGYRRWSGEAELVVELEGHGREGGAATGADLTRTVGWLTSHYPVRLAASAEGIGETLRGVKERLRGVPGGGVGYGALKYMGGGSVPESGAGISFNYLGQFDQLLPESSPFVPSKESAGTTSSIEGKMSHLLRINAGVSEGQLEIFWTYSENVHERETVERFAGHFIAALQDIIAHCRLQETTHYTPSDFPLSALSQRELDLVVTAIRKADAAPPGRGRDNLEDIYALSPVQEGMIFQSLYDPAADVYFRQLSFVLRGELDVPAFVGAWQQVLERHAALRTGFFHEGLDAPVQFVRRRVEVPFELHDLSGLPQGARETRLDELLAAVQSRGISLTHAPLMQLMLIRLEEHVHRYVWSYHHLMIDGWSRAQVQQEVLAIYEAGRDGRQPRLESCRQYRDYIEWLRGKDLTEAETFWRKNLAGFRMPTPLGASRRPRAAADTEEHAGVERLFLTEEATVALQTAARRLRLTLNTIMQGAWALMLGRLSGERDVVFGAVVSGRPTELEGSESVVGLFINTLPVRVRLDPEQTVRTWLEVLQDEQAELRRYEYSPLVEVQRWSEVPRGRRLFESTVNFGNYWVDDSLREEREGIGVSDVRFIEKTGDALVLGAEMGTTLMLQLLYDTRRFDGAAVASMLRDLCALLPEMTGDTERSLGKLLSGGAGEESADASHDPEGEGDAEAQFVF
jgi:amino acid adenylation domain-containing protein/non-ribosomal peptide synthase protein (TIGR01720 family)